MRPIRCTFYGAEKVHRTLRHAGYAVDRKKTRRYGRSVIRPGRGLRNGPFLSPKPPIPTSLQTSRTVFTDDRDTGKENPVIPYRNRPAHLKKKSQSSEPVQLVYPVHISLH